MHETIVTGAFTVVVAVLGVFGAWLAAKQGAKSALKTADAAAQDTINAGFKTLMDASEEARASLEAQVAELTGHVRQLVQHVDSLEIILRDQGLPVPVRPFPHPLALPIVLGDTIPRAATGWGS